DRTVTGVQTCALPISSSIALASGKLRLMPAAPASNVRSRKTRLLRMPLPATCSVSGPASGSSLRFLLMDALLGEVVLAKRSLNEIGRASCRERGEVVG